MCVCLLIEMHLVYKAENGTTTAEDYNDDAQGELQPYVMQTHTHTHTSVHIVAWYVYQQRCRRQP